MDDNTPSALSNQRKLAKAKRNRDCYQRSKAAREAWLIRLEQGGLAIIDEAARCAGLSRAAFFRDVMLPHVAALQASKRGAITRDAKDLQTALACQEFDRLFIQPEGS